MKTRTVYHCEHCGRALDARNKVELELDQRVGEYHDFGGVPESESQGWFDFGIDCAAGARGRARERLKALGLEPL